MTGNSWQLRHPLYYYTRSHFSLSDKPICEASSALSAKHKQPTRYYDNRESQPQLL